MLSDSKSTLYGRQVTTVSLCLICAVELFVWIFLILKKLSGVDVDLIQWKISNDQLSLPYNPILTGTHINSNVSV